MHSFETLKVRAEGNVLFAEISVPPMNLLGPELVRDLVSLVLKAEADEDMQVVVFTSADAEYFIAHVDVTRVTEYREAATRLAGEPSLGMLFRRLSESRLVTIAQIAGRVRAAGNEFVLACDMRFAARESAIFSQFEPALGVIPGAGGAQHLTRLLGRARALEVMLSAGDYDAELAERYGWINRALPGSALDDFVRTLAHRIASFPAAGRTALKNRVNAIALASAEEFRRDSDLFAELFRSPDAQRRMGAAQGIGFQTRDGELDMERLIAGLDEKPADIKWDVFVTPAPRIESDDKPPGVTDVFFQATACTLIYGERDAVLVDALLTEEQANTLADWVAGHKKNLTHIYITHGHGDHWYGLRTLLARFPGAKGVATRETINAMRKQSSPEALAHWSQSLPGKIPRQLTIAEALEGDVTHLEGTALVAVELGHTDTDATTCLHVPSVGLVIAGDAAYNDVHLYLVESTHDTRQEWIAALDKMEGLKPRAVVASHKRPDSADDPRIIEETRQYIRDFDRLAQTASNALDLYESMLALYPNRVNPQWALWSSARAAMKDIRR